MRWFALDPGETTGWASAQVDPELNILPATLQTGVTYTLWESLEVLLRMIDEADHWVVEQYNRVGPLTNEQRLAIETVGLVKLVLEDTQHPQPLIIRAPYAGTLDLVWQQNQFRKPWLPAARDLFAKAGVRSGIAGREHRLDAAAHLIARLHALQRERYGRSR